MIYYKRHLGDYARKTGHLTAEEHGIYSLLLDHYYSTEKPIPKEKARRIAKSNPEITQMVCEEFFVDGGDCWIHERANEEISEYRLIEERNRANGVKGGRPKTQNKPKPNPDETQSVQSGHPKPNPIHNPLSIIHKQEKDLAPKGAQRGTRLPKDWVLPDAWFAWTREQLPNVNANLEASKFRDHWIAATGRNASKLDWEATWRNWCRNSRPNGSAQPAASQHVPTIKAGQYS